MWGHLSAFETTIFRIRNEIILYKKYIIKYCVYEVWLVSGYVKKNLLGGVKTTI